MDNMFISQSIASENALQLVKFENRYDIVTDDLGDFKEHWINTQDPTHGNIKVLVEYTEDPQENRLIDYGVNVAELRTKTFLLALLEDGDVNHALGMRDNEIPTDSLKAVCEFISGHTNRIPCTPCGLENYVIDHLHFDYKEIAPLY